MKNDISFQHLRTTHEAEDSATGADNAGVLCLGTWVTVLCQDFGDVWCVGTWVTVRVSCGRGLRVGWWGRAGGGRRR